MTSPFPVSGTRQRLTGEGIHQQKPMHGIVIANDRILAR